MDRYPQFDGQCTGLVLVFSFYFWLGDKTTFMSSGTAWEWIAWALGILGIIFSGPAYVVAAVFVFTRWRAAFGGGAVPK
jgi:hypothetical protein